MPKKFVGENSKAVVARQRKSASKEADTVKKQKDEEDASWKDDDKRVNRKMQRQEDMERKKQQQVEKKAEKKALLEQEMGSIQVSAKVPASKITRAQIQTQTEKRNAAAQATTQKTNKPKTKTHLDEPIQENINRMQPEEIANTIDEALAMLSTSDNPLDDKHPEKRMKAAYTAFEEKNLPRLKADNPSLRISQLKQMLFKEWSKSSENPLNKPK